MNPLNETAHEILDLAEHFTQTRGFNAFSYRDIQDKLGIKTSSIHYYFPSKQDLALAMLERYLERYQITLATISASKDDALHKLQSLADIFISAAKKDKFCLCGMLTMDVAGMPSHLHKQLKKFFEISETWIAEMIKAGIKAKQLSATIHPNEEATHFLAILEGGLLIAHARKNDKYFSTMVKEFLRKLRI